jgi:hypothetical protein
MPGSNEVRTAASLAVGWLTEPDTPLGPVAHTTLALALVSAMPEVRALACETLIQAAGDGRLRPEFLGRAFHHLVEAEGSTGQPRRAPALV